MPHKHKAADIVYTYRSSFGQKLWLIAVYFCFSYLWLTFDLIIHYSLYKNKSKLILIINYFIYIIQKYFPLTRKACCPAQLLLEKYMEKYVGIP